MQELLPLQAGLFRGLAQFASPGGRRGSLLILMFHRVLVAPDELNSDYPSAEVFEAQMRAVGAVFNVMSLGEAAARLSMGDLPGRSACITFDDGYEDNRTVAAPILARLGMTATFFIATGFVGDGRMWNDTVLESVRRAPAALDLSRLGLGQHQLPDAAARQRVVADLLAQLKYLPQLDRQRVSDAIADIVASELPRNLMMNERQIRELAALGMEIGAHTVTHPILAGLPDDAANQEIRDSKHVLESMIGCPVRSFAFPNGRPGRDYARSHARMVQEAGYIASVSTAWGCARAESDPFQLPRVSPWDQSATAYVIRLLRAYLQSPASVA